MARSMGRTDGHIIPRSDNSLTTPPTAVRDTSDMGAQSGCKCYWSCYCQVHLFVTRVRATAVSRRKSSKRVPCGEPQLFVLILLSVWPSKIDKPFAQVRIPTASEGKLLVFRPSPRPLSCLWHSAKALELMKCRFSQLCGSKRRDRSCRALGSIR